MIIIWSEEFSVGVKIIDEQHKHFVEILNKLNEAIDESRESELDSILKELIEYKKYHFETEERYFDEFMYEGAKEHKEIHASLSEKAEGFLKRNDEPKMQIALDLHDFLEDWLLEHLANEDKKYTKCFNEHGLV